MRVIFVSIYQALTAFSFQPCENGSPYSISVGEPFDHLDNYINLKVTEDLIEEEEELDEVLEGKQDVEKEKNRSLL